MGHMQSARRKTNCRERWCNNARTTSREYYVTPQKIYMQIIMSVASLALLISCN